jgi:hypothetical protein
VLLVTHPVHVLAFEHVEELVLALVEVRRSVDHR